MAIPHLTTKPVSRSSSGNAVHAAAYIARTRGYDERTGQTWDYSRFANEVLWQGLYVPKQAPEWMHDRAALWNSAEQTETRINSRVARSIEVGLPHELTTEQNQWLLQDFVRENFQRKGIVADVAMHRAPLKGDQRNVHAHILLGTRTVTAAGFGDKDRDLDKVESLEAWRAHWEKTVNRHLERHGVDRSISMESYVDQGLDRTPGIHLGKDATALERQGVETDRGNEQREVGRQNAQRVIDNEMLALENGNTIDQAGETERKKRLAAMEHATKQLASTPRKQDTDYSLLDALKHIVHSVGNALARLFRPEREAPAPQPETALAVDRLFQTLGIDPDQPLRDRMADLNRAPKNPTPDQLYEYVVEGMEKRAARQQGRDEQTPFLTTAEAMRKREAQEEEDRKRRQGPWLTGTNREIDTAIWQLNKTMPQQMEATIPNQVFSPLREHKTPVAQPLTAPPITPPQQQSAEPVKRETRSLKEIYAERAAQVKTVDHRTFRGRSITDEPRRRRPDEAEPS